MPRKRFFSFPFLCMQSSSLLPPRLPFHSGNPHRFSQWQQAPSGMAVPFHNTKDKDLLKKLKPF